MLWGTDGIHTTGWLSAIESFISGATGSKYILGFNEPDNTGQANLSPQDAANQYLQYITKYSGNAKLVSPAVTSSTQQGQGLSWFQDFMGYCSTCEISALAVHWYGDSIEELKTFVEQAVSAAADHNLSEVWLTEFALNADTNGVQDQGVTTNFVQQAIAFLDSHPTVTRYSYFKAAQGFTVSGSSLNSVGAAYVS